MFISVIKSLLFYMSWILCKCRIHVNFSYLLQFCIQFLYPFSSTSNKFNRKNLCFFSLQKKSISKSDKKPVFEPPESSVQRPIFQNLRETKKQKRNKYLKKTLEKWFSVYMSILVEQREPLMHSNCTCIWYTANFIWTLKLTGW